MSHHEDRHHDPHHDPHHYEHHEPPHHDEHHEPVHHREHHEERHHGCFIATAVHGPDAIEVLTLRAFRDEVLLARRAGRAFVAAYYRLSPPLAKRIEGSEPLRALARRLIVTPAYRLALRWRRR